MNRIKSVTPLPNMILQVVFQNGIEKKYDVKNLYEIFPQLKELESDNKLYKKVDVDVGGYGISWNDDLDLDAEEIWNNGIETGKIIDIDIYSKIGSEVSRARAYSKITQKQLSEKTGIYQADISKIERGIGNPSIATLKRIAEGLGMELNIEFVSKK
ncbi:helix-turn-helix domain-containing protein [uncultured Eubacterium sp.]|uniref:helix-turn-helix domain-containing protein n=1 Tax=uncultured Eubacterium sp. TaxID=165185 RepID=UPI00338F349A